MREVRSRPMWCAEPMTTPWPSSELDGIATADELEIAVENADGTLRRWTPIWVVCVDEQVYVRTWHRREGGWFGHALRSGRAHVRVPGVEAAVTVEDTGADPPHLRVAVDAAYRTKYGRFGRTSVDAMVADDAAATTLRLSLSEERDQP